YQDAQFGDPALQNDDIFALQVLARLGQPAPRIPRGKWGGTPSLHAPLMDLRAAADIAGDEHKPFVRMAAEHAAPNAGER
ncbi:MAG TPA: hypothetical protein VFH47_04650, partial [Candidatus Thermoplasmatota archaeon]|nr:hypothetical protein [Candidatus Thermoplasmatota archaeon]